MTTDPKLPDRMGVWGDDGVIVWLPREYYPTRTDARRFMMAECDMDFIQIRVLSRWMKYQPHEYPNRKLVDGEWVELEPIIEDWWVCCEASEDGAFPVWECS